MKSHPHPLKIALIIMRLQPQHTGHSNLIFKAMMECDLVIIMPGSSQEKRTKRNPLNTPEKLNNLKTTTSLIHLIYYNCCLCNNQCDNYYIRGRSYIRGYNRAASNVIIITLGVVLTYAITTVQPVM